MSKVGYLLLILSVDWLLKFTQYFETYIFRDWGFARYLIILVMLDTLLGTYRAKKQGKFEWKCFDKILDKLISYTSILVLIHVITSFTVEDRNVTVFHWARVSVLSALMAKEGYSILKNIAAVNTTYVPMWLMDKLREIDKSGKFFSYDNNKETNKKKQKK